MTNRIKLLLLIVFLLSIFLRFYSLSRNSLWVDEIITLNLSEQKIANIISDRLNEGFTPAYFVLMQSWVFVFGKSEYALRFLSAFFGVLAIPLFFYLVMKILDAKTALFSSFLLALSEVHLWQSQNARMYEITFFFIIFSLLFFWQLLKRDSKSCWCAYALTTLIALSMHYLSILSTLSQWLFLIFFCKKLGLGKRKLIALLALQTSLMVLFALLILRYPGAGVLSWLPPLSLKTIEQYFIRLSPMWHVPLQNIFHYNLLLCYGIAILAVTKLLKDKRILETGFLIILFIIPHVILIIVSLVKTPVFGPTRYLIFTTIPLYIFIAYGLLSIKNTFNKKLWIGVFISLSLYSAVHYLKTETRDPWRKVANYLQNSRQKNELVFLYPDFDWSKLPFDYYFKNNNYTGITDIYQIKANSPGIWIVISHQDKLKRHTLNKLCESRFKERFFYVEKKEFICQEEEDFHSILLLHYWDA